MKFNQDQLVSGLVLVACCGLGYILLTGLGKIKSGGNLRSVLIDFGRVDNIKANVTEVKLAGFPVGKVVEVRLLTPDERRQLESKLQQNEKTDMCIRVLAKVDPAVLVSTNTVASIRQASLMSEHYIELSASPLDAVAAPEDYVVSGASAAGVGDLLGSGGAGALMANLKDTTEDLRDTMKVVNQKVPALLDSMNLKLPDILDKLDSVLGNAKDLTGDLSSPETRERLKALVNNLKVMSENLKVVSTHAKLITGTLGQRPWRLMFGGKPNTLPDEEAIIKSQKAYPVKPAEQN